jgi:hypothetical protein
MPTTRTGAINYLTNRRDNYSLNDENTLKENNIIKQILHNKKYDATILQKPLKILKVHKDQKPPTHTTSWARFTYIASQNHSRKPPSEWLTPPITPLTDSCTQKTTTSGTDTKCPEYTS